MTVLLAQAVTAAATTTAYFTQTGNPLWGPVAANPSGFNPAWYLHARPDVAAAGIDPYTHYRDHGSQENTPPFEPVPAGTVTRGQAADSTAVLTAYVTQNIPDLYGAIAGQPDGFNVAWYLFANPDILAAKVDPLTHYLAYGRAEGRLPYKGAPVAPVVVLAPLPLLDLTGMALWNWDAEWTAAEWGADFTALPSKYDHVAVQPNGDVTLTLDAAAGATLQGENRMVARTSGLWEIDVTLPPMRDGVVVAPLWLLDAASADEIDFEFPGRTGLALTSHQNGQSAGVTVQAGHDFSNQRVRLGIRMDQAAGYVDMLLDGLVVHRFGKTGPFPTHGLKALIDIVPFDPNNAGLVSWCGKWTGMAAGEKLVMTVHGYSYTAL